MWRSNRPPPLKLKIKVKHREKGRGDIPPDDIERALALLRQRSRDHLISKMEKQAKRRLPHWWKPGMSEMVESAKFVEKGKFIVWLDAEWKDRKGITRQCSVVVRRPKSPAGFALCELFHEAEVMARQRGTMATAPHGKCVMEKSSSISSVEPETDEEEEEYEDAF